MHRPTQAGLVALLLLASLITTAPAATANEPDPRHRLSAPSPATSLEPRGALDGAEIDVPDVPAGPRARSAAASSIAVGQSLEFPWKDCTRDPDLGEYVCVLTVDHARDGMTYQAALRYAGPTSVFVVDAQGDLVTYGSHPNAWPNRATVEWEYRTGDVLLLVGGQYPQLHGAYAKLELQEFADQPVPGVSNAKPLTTQVTGQLQYSSAWLPFHGGHYDRIWTKPNGTSSGQDDVVLYFDGDPADTDWLSVVVLDVKGFPQAEYAVEDGVVWFPLEAGQSFVVTSQLPDDSGWYTFDWEVLPLPAQVQPVTPEGISQTEQVPLYRVKWATGGRHLASFELPQPTYRVEVSRDGAAWEPAVTEGAVDATRGALIRLWDGDWSVRVVLESDGLELASSPVRLTATGDRAGWRVTSLHLPSAPITVYTGTQSAWRSLDGVVGETYRDGRTRQTAANAAVRVEFRRAGSTQWVTLGTLQGGEYWMTGTGTLRLATGSIVSNEVPVTSVAMTQTYRGAVVKPTKSATVGGAVRVQGSVTQQFADGTWRPIAEGRWYQVQRKSGKKWVKVHSAQVRGGAGTIDDTVSLPGSGTYRLTVEGKPVATWSLKLPSATKTARISAPTVSRHVESKGTTWNSVAATATQRFSDGRWGPAKHGWKYTVQYRAAGTKKWRTVSKHSVHTPGQLSDHFRTAAGAQEFRVVGTFKGRTYTSPIARA